VTGAGEYLADLGWRVATAAVVLLGALLLFGPWP
jgi:hypothetical protein